MKYLLFLFLIMTSLLMSSCNDSAVLAKDGSNNSTIDTLVLKKTAKLLDEDLYWNIVDRSLKNTSSQDEQEYYLITEIKKLSAEEIIGFRLRTDQLLFNTYSSDMWCAAYIMNGGCSDDGFEYFRNWLISRGKNVYYTAKANPDDLISEVVDGTEYYEFENFSYVAIEAFEQKTGKDLYDYIDDSFQTDEMHYPSFEFTWKEDDPESMKKICPRLYEKIIGDE